jgi:hypothetical protein
MNKLIFAILLSTLVSVPVLAADSPIAENTKNESASVVNPVPTQQQDIPTLGEQSYIAKKNYYVLSDIGILRHSSATSTYDSQSLPNTGEISLGGGYRFNSFVSIEGAYSYVANSNLNSSSTLVLAEELKTSIVHVAGVGTYTIDSDSDVYVKLGVAQVHMQYNFYCPTFTPASGSGSSAVTNLMYGIGTRNNIDKSHSIYLQYENFGNTKITTAYNNGTSLVQNIGTAVISVGVEYFF